MNKLLACVVVAGVAVGAIYLLCKTKKEENIYSKSMEDKYDFDSDLREEPLADNQDAVEETYETKKNSAQAVHERHAEATSIMTDSFKNIMEAVEPIENLEESVDQIIDTKDAETIKELESLSNELDELLK